jgi:asparagine synthase (glutamine-hydrolysing)
MSLVPKLADIYDQPFGDSSAVPTTLISSIARKHVTVALSADGGDELFAGYPRHLKSLGYINKFSGFPGFVKSILSGVRPSNHKSLAEADRYDKLRSVLKTKDETVMFDVINQTYSSGELKKLLNFKIRETRNPFIESRGLSARVDTLNKILAVDYTTYLVDDILQKVDRASMSVSLEAREPFLDHRLLEFLSVVPSKYKLEGKFQKKILKDIVHKYIPKTIMDRPKMGFGIPLNLWCRTELKELFMDFMSDDALKSNELLNFSAVKEVRDAYLKGQLQNFERIWFVFIYQMWNRRWM